MSDCPDLKSQCGNIFGEPNGAAGVDIFGVAGGMNLNYGTGNPASGCNALVSIECETNQEIGQAVRAQNKFGFTSLSALQTASADFIQSIDEANMRYSQPSGDPVGMYVRIQCSGPGNGSWECSPWGPYAQLFAPGWEPFFSDKDAELRYIARGVQAGAGGIGDPRFIAGVYAASFGGAAVGAVAADISAVEEGQLFGTRFNGNYPLLNTGNDSFRIGWWYYGETQEYFFRININGVHIFLSPSWYF